MKKWMGRLTVSVLVVLLLVGIASASDSISIKGLLHEKLIIPLAVIKGLPQLTEDVVAVNSAGNESHFSATGALFGDLLAQYGKTQENILGIRLIASDGYSIDVPREVLAKRQIILAYEVDGLPLDEGSAPLRIVIPGERPMYWVRNLTEIEIIDQVTAAEVQSIRFLETWAEVESLENYAYHTDLDQAINLGKALQSLELDQEPSRVFLKAADGFEKSEATAVFRSGYIKMTGINAPLFLSAELPKGMHVKDIVFFTLADNGFVSLTQALNYYGPQMVDDVVGIKLAVLLADLGMMNLPH